MFSVSYRAKNKIHRTRAIFKNNDNHKAKIDDSCTNQNKYDLL